MAEFSGGVPLPLFLMVGLGLLAALLYIVRQWERWVAGLATLLTVGVGIWLWQATAAQLSVASLAGGLINVDLAAGWQGLGFGMEAKVASMPILTLYFGLAATAFGLAALYSQGRSLVPLTLLLLAGYAGLTLISSAPVAPDLIAPLLLVALTSGSVFVLQAGRLGPPRAALRLLLPPVLAFPIFLLAGWYVEQIPLNPQDSDLLATISRLLGVGMLILLAPFPLHGAHGSSAQGGPPVATAIVILFYELAVLNLFNRVLSDYPYVWSSAPLGNWLVWAGTLTAVWGGVAALGAAHPGRLWSYVSLHDWGLIILALAMPGVRRWPLVLLLFLMRAFNLLISAGGLAALEDRLGHLTLAQIQGAGSRLPWNSALYVMGGLGLLGFPLTAGFTGHWSTIQMVAAVDWQFAAAILLASAAAAVGYVRVVRLLFGLPPGGLPARESTIGAGAAIGLLLISLFLALSPQGSTLAINHLLIAFR